MIQTKTTIPVGVLLESDLIARFPARRAEVIAFAMTRREEALIGLHETRKMLSWHPFHLLKTVVGADHLDCVGMEEIRLLQSWM